jgi:hypothetical protein
MRKFDNLLGNYHVHSVLKGKINKNCLGNYTNLHSQFNVNIKFRFSLSTNLFKELGTSVYNYTNKYDKFGDLLRSDKSLPINKDAFIELVSDAILIDLAIAINILNRGSDTNSKKMSLFCKENFNIYLEKRTDYKCLPLTNNIINFKVHPKRTDNIVLKTNIGLTKVLQQQQASACSLMSSISDQTDLDKIFTTLKAQSSKTSILKSINSVEEILDWSDYPMHYKILTKLDSAKCLEFTNPSVNNSWKAIGDYMNYTSNNDTGIEGQQNEGSVNSNSFIELGLDSDGFDQYTAAFNCLYQIHLDDPIGDPLTHYVDQFLNNDLIKNGYNYTSANIALYYTNFIYSINRVSVNSLISTTENLDSGYVYNIINKRQKEVMHSLALGVELDAPLTFQSSSSGSNPSSGPSKTNGPDSGPTGSNTSVSQGPNNPGQQGQNPSQVSEGANESSSNPDVGTSSNSMELTSFALGEEALQESISEAVSEGTLSQEESVNAISKIANTVKSLGRSSVNVAGSILIKEAINRLTNKGEISPVIQNNYNNNFSIANHVDAEFSAVKANLGIGRFPK